MDLALPSNLYAEQVTLSRIMNNFDDASIAFERLHPTDFTNPIHVAIFQALLELSISDYGTGPSIIYEKLKSLPATIQFADMNYILKLAALYSPTDEIEYLIETLQKLTKYRAIITQCHYFAQKAAKQEATPEVIQNGLLDFIDSTFGLENENSCFTTKSLLQGKHWDEGKHTFFEHIQDKMEKFKEGIPTLTGYSTGYPRLDQVLDGLNKGHYICIGARSGIGKSTFALNLIYNLITSGIKVYLQSIEMKKQENLEKLVATCAGISRKRMMQGNLTIEEYQHIMNASQELYTQNLMIDDSPQLTVNQFCAKVRRAVQAWGIQVVVVDYLTQLSAEGKYSTMQEQVQYISKRVCSLAKKLQIPIIAICQLNRSSETENRKPRKSDLRESGQIEQDAHTILMLWRPNEQANDDRKHQTQVCVVKNRFGPQEDIDFKFDPHKDRVIELPKISQVLERAMKNI